MHPETNELYELQQTLYTSKNPTRRWLHRTRRDYVVAAIERWSTRASGRACGDRTGFRCLPPRARRVADEVVAADIEDAELSQLVPLAETPPNLRLERDDITKSSFESESFDLALCSEVIEHIPDSKTASRTCTGSCDPGACSSSPRRSATAPWRSPRRWRSSPA